MLLIQCGDYYAYHDHKEKYLNCYLNIFKMVFLNLLLSCFYFMLPAYFANMAPVIVRKINFLKIPMDFGKTINNKPIFGKYKTFRGFIFGVLFAIIASYVQHLFYDNNIFAAISLIDYSNWLLVGFLLGFGAIFGDLMKSLVKRRLNYEPGEMFVPFDQVDFIIGALIFTYPFIPLSLDKLLVIIFLSFTLHVIVNHIAFYTKVRNERW